MQKDSGPSGTNQTERQVYRLVVDGCVEATFLARNKFHAMNHAAKHHAGLHSIEYAFAGRHEVRASRIVKGCDDVDFDVVTVCGFCEREIPACVACEQGGATQRNPHVHHECAQMRARG
jgi:hypothetical protein